jgi:O-antigen ligase
LLTPRCVLTVSGMYLKFLRFVAATCLLFTFWSVLRLGGVSVFEVLAPFVIFCGLLYKPQRAGPGLDAFTLALAGLALLTLAGVISSPSSFGPVEHMGKVLRLVGAFVLVIGLSYVLTNRRILTTMQVFYLLALSGAACSAVAILQGQFGVLSGLIPQPDPGSDITRMTGLAEHPIECGIVAAYSAAIAAGIGIVRRKWLVAAVIVATDVYSMKFSASITSILAFMVGTGFLCVYAKAYRILFTGTAVGIIALIVGSSLSNNSSFLAERLADLYRSGGNFATVQSREMQLRKALDMIDVKALFVGNGYSTADLPYKMEIHNGIIAAVFHFGLLGLVSQCFLISFFLSRMWQNSPRAYRAIHLACITVFALSYLSGPPQARPSLWAPVIILGSILTVKRGANDAMRANVRASAQPLNRSNGSLGRYA